jgi:hypothetical protein
MPLLENLKEKPSKPGFKKKAYRSWDLLDMEPSPTPSGDAKVARTEDNQVQPGTAGATRRSSETPGGDLSRGSEHGQLQGSADLGAKVAASNSRQELMLTETGHNRAQNEVQSPISAQGRTHERKQGTTRHNQTQPALERGTPTGHKEAQAATDPGTTEHNETRRLKQPGTLTGHKEAQERYELESDPVGDDWEQASRVVMPHSRGQALDMCPVETLLNGAQPGTVPGCEAPRAQLNTDMCPVETLLNGAQPGTVPGCEAPRAQLQPGTKTGHNEVPVLFKPGTETRHNRAPGLTKPALPGGAQQMLLLRYFIEQQANFGLGHTPRLKRVKVATALAISPVGIKNQIRRLCQAGVLERLDARDGRGDSGTVYRVPDAVIRAVQAADNRALKLGTTGHGNTDNRALKLGTTGHGNGARESASAQVVSTSFGTITTTSAESTSFMDECDHADQLQELVQRFNLDVDFRIGANDLLGALRASSSTMERFAKSVEHAAFYLRSPDAKGLTHPKAWTLRQLRQGFYPQPAGFVSWEEQQLLAELEADRARADRVRHLKQQKFDCALEAWILELSDDKRSELFKHAGHISPTGPAAKAFLREAYARETNQLETLRMLDKSDEN